MKPVAEPVAKEVVKPAAEPEEQPEARMKPPVFDVACPAWVRKPERNLADERWPEDGL